ncbi:hypothetical protein [Streptomyces sasae]|uniref:hypothetical protein n=1 Tax=Streptomyces sasae TaxID=1266772 RepID=UPI002930E769|nr:hypothetical protein [Streptomyces sasae]
MWSTTRHAGRQFGGSDAERSPTPFRHLWSAAFGTLRKRRTAEVGKAEVHRTALSSDADIRQRTAANDTYNPDALGHAAALECVRLVIAWYNRAIHLERYALPPDPMRLDELLTERQRCLAERKYLDEATPEQADRMAQDYSTLFRELTRRNPELS